MSQTRHYSDYLSRVCSLVGIPVNGLTSDEQVFFQEYFRSNSEEIWQRTNWNEICPYGEARLVGNLVQYANAYTNPNGNWSALNLTVTDNQFANPADARVTAASLFETSATGVHSLTSATFNLVPNIAYQFSFFVRPNGRQFCKLSVTDTASYSAFLSLTGNGSVVSASGCNAFVQLVGNGYYLCAIGFTSSLTALTGTASFTLSTDGSTTSYAGDTTKGVYAWGWWMGQAQDFPANSLIPWEQTGEDKIDTVFQVWKNSPNAPSYPRPAGYQQVKDGIQIIGGTDYYNWQNYPYFGFSQPLAGTLVFYPVVFLAYRKQIYNYTGAAYSATATYSVGDSILFTNSSSVQDFYECASATSSGQSPDTSPASWIIQPVLDVFFKYIVYGAYADWLRQDGQTDKADRAEAQAEGQADSQFDILERQNRNIAPWQVATHVTSQIRFS